MIKVFNFKKGCMFKKYRFHDVCYLINNQISDYFCYDVKDLIFEHVFYNL